MELVTEQSLVEWSNQVSRTSGKHSFEHTVRRCRLTEKDLVSWSFCHRGNKHAAWLVCPSPEHSSTVNVKVLRSRALKRWLGHEGLVLMSAIRFPYRTRQRKLLLAHLSSITWRPVISLFLTWSSKVRTWKQRPNPLQTVKLLVLAPGWLHFWYTAMCFCSLATKAKLGKSLHMVSKATQTRATMQHVWIQKADEKILKMQKKRQWNW